MAAYPSRSEHAQARACWIVAPGRAEIRDAEIGSGEVSVRTLHSAVSRGTEMLVFRGQVPDSEFERMRAPFQEGDFPHPVKYGYANVGTVDDGPPGWQGRHVFSLFPHQTRFRVPTDALHMLPDGLPPGRAVLAANMETAVNAIWDAAPQLGDRIAVVGGGVVGLLVAWLASRVPACAVELIDTRAERRATAEILGLRFALPSEATQDADLVIHASGQPQGLVTALSLAAFEATVLEMSWYGAQAVALPLGQAFHSRRLMLKSSQVGHVAATQRARWSRSRRMALALDLLRDPVLDALITDSAPFEQMPQVFERLAKGAPDTLCQRIDYA